MRKIAPNTLSRREIIVISERIVQLGIRGRLWYYLMAVTLFSWSRRLRVTFYHYAIARQVDVSTRGRIDLHRTAPAASCCAATSTVPAARQQPSNTVRSRHGDAEDLAGSRRCGAEVRDVEVAVRAE